MTSTMSENSAQGDTENKIGDEDYNGNTATKGYVKVEITEEKTNEKNLKIKEENKPYKKVESMQDGREITISDDMADACKTICQICQKVFTLSSMNNHTKKKHNMTITEYKRKYGKFGQGVSQIIKTVHHRCHLCDSLMLLDSVILKSHTTSMHKMNVSEYKTHFMKKKNRKNVTKSLQDDSSQPSKRRKLFETENLKMTDIKEREIDGDRVVRSEPTPIMKFIAEKLENGDYALELAGQMSCKKIVYRMVQMLVKAGYDDKKMYMSVMLPGGMNDLKKHLYALVFRSNLDPRIKGCKDSQLVIKFFIEYYTGRPEMNEAVDIPLSQHPSNSSGTGHTVGEGAEGGSSEEDRQNRDRDLNVTEKQREHVPVKHLGFQTKEERSEEDEKKISRDVRNMTVQQKNYCCANSCQGPRFDERLEVSIGSGNIERGDLKMDCKDVNVKGRPSDVLTFVKEYFKVMNLIKNN